MPEQESGNNPSTETADPYAGGLNALFTKTYGDSNQQTAPETPPVAIKEETKTETAQEPVKTPEPVKKAATIFDTEKKEEPKKVETAPVVDADPFEGVKENDWKAAKAAAKARQASLSAEKEAAAKERDTIKAERDTIKKQLDEYHAKVPDTAEVEKLRKEYTSAAERLKVLDYQSTPEFRNQFVIPKDNTVNEAKQILADNGVTEDVDFLRLTEKPRIEFAKTVSEIADKLNDQHAFEFRNLMSNLQKQTAAEKQALSHASQNLSQIGEITKVRQRKVFEEVFSQSSLPAFAKAQEVAQDDPPEVKQIKEQFNTSLQGYRDQAEKAVFGLASDADAARLGIEATNYQFMVKNAFPLMQAEYQKQVARANALEERISGLLAATPKDGTDKGGNTSNAGPQTLSEAIVAAGLRP